MTAWGGIVAVYLGAQGSVEYKSTAALESLNKDIDVRKQENDQFVYEGKPGDIKPWTPVAKDE